MLYSETSATKKIMALRQKIRAVQGGCLGIGTKILMFDLSYKNVEDIIVGDKLMGIDGKPRNVLKLCRGKSQLYKVKQKKGIDYVVNDEHILVTEDQGRDLYKTTKGKKKYIGRKREDGLFKIRAEDFFSGSNRKTVRQYKGIKTGLDFSKKEVKIDPYYLGLWLGDGCSRSASITNVDKEVLDYLFDEIPKIYDVFVLKQDNVTTKITKNKGKYNEIVQRLKYYDLILNKHIPKDFIYNDKKTRLRVLAGLIDSDGCLSRDSKTKKPKGYTIVQKRKQLSDDILLLCRTLGFYCTQHKRISKMKREDGSIYECDTYMVSIFMKDYSELPVKVSRKKYNFLNNKNPLRSTIELEKLDIGDYYGFELDGDHLFLLEDFTITHNTSASKTISIILYLIALCQTDKSKTLTSIISESTPHLKRGAMRDFKNIMQNHDYWDDKRWNATDSLYTFETGSQLEFFSADQADKLRGGRRDRCFMNEANNMTLEAFDQLEVRTKEFIFLDWNPTNEFWFYMDICKCGRKACVGSRSDVDHLILNYKDNEALSKEIITSIESRMTRKGWWQVYGLGELGEVEGIIYKNWKVVDEIPHEAKLIRRGLDFGYTNDPSSIVDIYSYDGGYILNEQLYQKGLSNKQIADYIGNYEDPNILIVADSAEPKSIDELKSYGLNIIGADKGKDSVAHGIQLVQDQRISVTKKSINIIREYRNYMWETDRDGKFISPNKPEHAFSHSMDAIRYGIGSLLKTPFVDDEELYRIERNRQDKARINLDYGL